MTPTMSHHRSEIGPQRERMHRRRVSISGRAVSRAHLRRLRHVGNFELKGRRVAETLKAGRVAPFRFVFQRRIRTQAG